MRALATAVTAAALLIGTAACTTGGMDARISNCLRDAGQDSSLENIDKRRVEKPGFNQAFEACAASNGLKVRPAGEEIRQVDQLVLDLKRCMERAGWTVPEPIRGDHGALVWQGMDALVAADRTDAFQVDYRACEGSLQPAGTGHDYDDHVH